MEIKIKSTKFRNKFIYGDILENKKAQSIVIFLSGFSGSKNLPLFKKSSKEFLKSEFGVIRLNFCNDSDDKTQKLLALNPKDMTFSTYTSELKNIFDNFSKKYRTVILIGHSFGAVISILFLDKYKNYKKNTKVVLWEPSLLPWKKEWLEEDFYFDKTKQVYFGKKTKETLNKTFYKECAKTEDTSEIFRRLSMNACIIAVKNIAEKNAIKYFLKVPNKNNSKLLIMKGTGHLFGDKNSQKKLFQETINYLNSY